MNAILVIMFILSTAISLISFLAINPIKKNHHTIMICITSLGFLVFSILGLLWMHLFMQPTFTKTVHQVKIVNNIAIVVHDQHIINLNEYIKKNFTEKDFVEIWTPNHTFFTAKTCKDFDIRIVDNNENTNE